MTKKQPSSKGKRGPKSSAVEWTGGIIHLPVGLQETESRSSEVLVWLDEDSVVSSTFTPTGDALSSACESLREAMDEPMEGKPRKPTHLRVASKELAEVLRAGFPWLQVVVGPTPLVDATAEEFLAQLEEAEASIDYALPPLSDEMDAATVASYFGGVAALLRSENVAALPVAGALFGVAIPDLGIDEGVMSVGMHEGRLRLVLFHTVGGFVEFLNYDGGPLDDDAELTANVALSFEHKHNILEGPVQELEERRWEIAGEDAYPEWVVLGAVPGHSSPKPAQMQGMDAATLALTQILADPKLPAAWATDKPLSRGFVVETHHGPRGVRLTTPFMPEDPLPFNVLRALAELDLDIPEDQALREGVEGLLFDEFEASPEGQSLTQEIRTVPLVAAMSARHFGVTIGGMNADEFGELLVDWIPRKANIPAAEAKNVIDELHAFYRFLQREYDAPQAEECLSELTPEAAKALGKALADVDLFDPAKRILEEGRKEGFDIETPEGAEAWMRELKSRYAAEEGRGRPDSGNSKVSKTQSAKRKAKRKASRKARRKKR